LTTSSTSRESDNFYQPLQEDMDLDETEVATASSTKDDNASGNSSSPESSWILHAITQGDSNITQSSNDNFNEGTQQTQDSLEEHTTNGYLTKQNSATTLVDLTQSLPGDQLRGIIHIPPNPYQRTVSGTGGGVKGISMRQWETLCDILLRYRSLRMLAGTMT
jgi:hypothetical protein